MIKMQTLAAAAALCTLATAARAQLVVGVDAGVGAPNAWYIDMSTNVSTVLWNDTSVWGLTCDDPNGKVYVNNGTPMSVWDYGSGPTTTLLGNPISTVDGAAILFASLASDPTTPGRLWGGRNTNSATNPEGIYTIDVSVTPPLVTPIFYPGSTSYDWGGLGFNPANGKFYMTSDTAPTGVGAGLFEIDIAANTVTKLSSYPTGQTDIDGCEVIGNKVWLIGDDAGQFLYSWDLTLGAYDAPTLTQPSATTELFSGGGYAPSMFGPSGPTNYCTPGTSTNGCNAVMSATGQPSVTAATPCVITVSNVEGQKNGIVFYGLAQNGLSWGTGSTSFLCVKTPTQRTTAQGSGGTAGLCDGTLTLDWDLFQSSNPGALGQPWAVGEKVYVQAWFRDPPAFKTTNLSDGLEMTYIP